VHYPNIYPIHDHALTIEFSNLISEQAHQQVMQLKYAIQKNPFDGFIESVPAYSSIAIYFNQHTSAEDVKKYIHTYLSSNNEYPEQGAGRKIELPVCYDPSFALDLSEVMQATGLDHESIIRLHTEHEFKVFMIGFLPGFAYMGTLPKELEVARKKTPSAKIPAGSVAIAGKQTGVYPSSSPGGWNVIGRTPIRMFNPDQPPYSYLQAGDSVRFKPISISEYQSLQ
jgi:inhibitor of KinA